MERSGSLPLTLFTRSRSKQDSDDATLFIQYGSKHYPDEAGAEGPIIEVSNRYASRWKTLYQLRVGGLGQIGNPSFQTRPEYSNKWDSLQRIYGDVGPHESVLRPQLTHLDICNRIVSYRQVVAIFEGCPKLIRLS